MTKKDKKGQKRPLEGPRGAKPRGRLAAAERHARLRAGPSTWAPEVRIIPGQLKGTPGVLLKGPRGPLKGPRGPFKGLFCPFLSFFGIFLSFFVPGSF